MAGRSAGPTPGAGATSRRSSLLSLAAPDGQAPVSDAADSLAPNLGALER